MRDFAFRANKPQCGAVQCRLTAGQGWGKDIDRWELWGHFYLSLRNLGHFFRLSRYVWSRSPGRAGPTLRVQEKTKISSMGLKEGSFGTFF